MKVANMMNIVHRMNPSPKPVRPSRFGLNQKIAQTLYSFGYEFSPEWVDMCEESDSSDYFKDSGLNLNGQFPIIEDVIDRFRGRGKPKPYVKKDYITHLDHPGVLKIVEVSNPEASWTVEMKVVLNDEDIEKLIELLEKFIPHGKTVSLQADCHSAGDCFVGMVACFGELKIPYIPVSADIGCGICLVPVVKQLQLMNVNDFSPQQLHDFKLKVSLTARKVLARGKKAELGNIDSPFLSEVYRFLSWTEEDKVTWFDKCKNLFEKLSIPYGGDVVKFVMGFAQTLGSSGNHFMELSADKWGDLYFTIHSGSRGLGAIVYERIAGLCTLGYGTDSLALGWLRDLYIEAYGVLNTFAIMNRALCGISVLKSIGCETDGKTISECMQRSSLFREVSPEHFSVLVKGLTHNGIKIFVDHQHQQKIFIMCKGAIAISRKASCGIVALRCGDGCMIFNMCDPEANWEEVSSDSLFPTYDTIYDLTATDIILTGHGAGRRCSATSTWKKSSYRGLLDYYSEMEVIGNLSPNVLGDDPRSAYKSLDQIIPHLPLDEALSSSTLRTFSKPQRGNRPSSTMEAQVCQLHHL